MRGSAVSLTRALLLALTLGGCADVRLSVNWVATEEALREKCGNDFLPEPLGCARGGALVTPAQSLCEVYVLSRGAPSFDEHKVVETLGHEVLHCLTGRVHR